MKPNILFLMTDQMQKSILDPQHPCITPNFDRLMARGIHFRRAYTPNAICSPARASLMTGLLPHNHGVVDVTHNVDEDQCNIRLDKPHFAQHLQKAGYRTGYFGKWHVERLEELEKFGWDVNGSSAAHEAEGSPLYKKYATKLAKNWSPSKKFPIGRMTPNPPGYKEFRQYGVTDIPPEERKVGIVTRMASDFLTESLKGNQPWCCFVSTLEPHDPFIAGEEAFSKYNVDALPLPSTLRDSGAGRPNLYKKAGLAWKNLSDREHREARACYYASITEIDAMYGRILDQIEAAGQTNNTIVVLMTDHGEMLGAHGLYCKNISAYEEIYNIPLVMAGPGIASGIVSDARVGLHDVCPTILELVGAEPIKVPDSRSFATVLADPSRASEFQSGYAEYFGSRYRLSQRIYWEGDWKYVFNGFDFDEMYNLAEDPNEINNLAQDPKHAPQAERMMKQIWKRIEETGDRSLYNSSYPILRLAPFGPLLGK
jgi:arylsulfatase A-like enzyme